MNKLQHHEELISGIFEQLKVIFENSEQAIYLYFDDTHKVCNKKFTSLLGYKSPDEWSKVETSFPETFVAEKSRETLVTTYIKAMEKMAGSKINVTWKKKSGGTVDTTVIIVPVAYEGHLFALHFIS